MPRKRKKPTNLEFGKTGGDPAPQYNLIARPKKRPRRRSRRVMNAIYGPAFTGLKASTPIVTSLNAIKKIIKITPYDANIENQWLLDIPKDIWDNVIIPYFGVVDLALTRTLHRSFEPYWQTRFYGNQLVLRIPHDIPFNKITQVSNSLSDLYYKRYRTYTKENPLIVKIANGTYVAESSFREDDEEVNYVHLDVAMTVIGEDRDDTIIEGGFLIHGEEGTEDHVHMKSFTVRGSKRTGIRGYQGASFDLEDVLVEDCKTCGIVAYKNETKCKNVEIRNCGWSAVSASTNAKVIMEGRHTTVHGNCHNGIGDALHHGLSTLDSTAEIELIYPLTKELVAVDNVFHGNANWGGAGSITNVVANGLTWGRLTCLRDWTLYTPVADAEDDHISDYIDKRTWDETHEFVFPVPANYKTLSVAEKELIKEAQSVKQNKGDEFELRNMDQATIGRRTRSDVVVVDGTASGLHCTITPTFDSKNGKIISCTIRDSSSNGTWLNDRQLIKDEETKLWYGDIISLCQSHLNTDEEHVASFEFKKGLIEVEELRETFCYDTPQKKSASGVAY